MSLRVPAADRCRSAAERPLEFRTDVPPDLRTDGPRRPGDPPAPRGRGPVRLLRWALALGLLLLVPALCSGKLPW